MVVLNALTIRAGDIGAVGCPGQPFPRAMVREAAFPFLSGSWDGIFVSSGSMLLWQHDPGQQLLQQPGSAEQAAQPLFEGTG